VADVPEVPDWLARKITAFIRGARSGQITLNFTQGRVESFDLREHGRVGQSVSPKEGEVPRLMR
jgi:hypothetical protein